MLLAFYSGMRKFLLTCLVLGSLAGAAYAAEEAAVVSEGLPAAAKSEATPAKKFFPLNKAIRQGSAPQPQPVAMRDPRLGAGHPTIVRSRKAMNSYGSQPGQAQTRDSFDQWLAAKREQFSSHR